MASRDLETEFKEIIIEYAKEFKEDVEKALTLGGEEAIKALEQVNLDVSGQSTGEFKKSWAMKTKYRGVRYIGNTKVVKGNTSAKIPLSNILEYGEKSPHKGFIQRTFNQVKDHIYTIILSKLKK